MQKINVDEVTIDGQVYVPKGSEVISKGEIRIVVLQRGWILVGRLEEGESKNKLFNASVIRTWGTSKGLGELAKNGPLDGTKLDKTNGVVEFHPLTMVLSIACEEKEWKSSL